MSGVDPRRLADSYKPDFGLPWVPPPILPSREEMERMSPADLIRLSKRREAWLFANEQARLNPVGAGWILPSWKRVMDMWQVYPIHILLGGVRSGKSSLASRLCVWGLGNIPEAQLRAYHVNGDRSKQDQQPFVHLALPDKLKNLPTKRGPNHSIQFTQATGFTNDLLILPPIDGWSAGGRIDFGNYKQWESDSKVAEGFRAHIIWGDEAMPLKMFETLMYRLTDFHGRLILTFTTLEGWTPLVQDILGKVKTLEWRYSPHTKKKEPVIQESISRPGAIIHYFWTEDNAFIDADEFRKKLVGRSISEILAYAHGIPTKAEKAAFPLFSRDWNVVKHEDLPFIKDPSYEVTRYMVIDPGGAKNDFIAWFAIDRAATIWCYREWPDHASYGEWFLPGNTAEGKAGPAQKSLGYGVKKQVSTILELEKESGTPEDIFERLADPRMAAQERKGEDGAVTLFGDFEKAGMILVAARGQDEDIGIKMINEYLFFNTEEPRDSRNSPRFYVSDRCENFISMMEAYTASYRTENSKEASDVFRYLVTSGAAYFPKVQQGSFGTTGGY